MTNFIGNNTSNGLPFSGHNASNVYNFHQNAVNYGQNGFTFPPGLDGASRPTDTQGMLNPGSNNASALPNEMMNTHTALINPAGQFLMTNAGGQARKLLSSLALSN
jgi:hypothetical protein